MLTSLKNERTQELTQIKKYRPNERHAERKKYMENERPNDHTE